MSLTLSLKAAPPGRISLAGITPDRLAPLAIAEIERLPLVWGKTTCALGDFFRVHGQHGEHLMFDGMDARFADLGAGMRGGLCEVRGDAGDFVARDMRGGRLVVHGSVGQYAASGLVAGELVVMGHAGDSLGAALPWLGAGMRGGQVVVHGNVGQRCGDKMRRGEIFIGGHVGDFLAARMVAGTIAVAGGLGAHVGRAMRRGTLVLLTADYSPAPTFVETVMCADAYLNLLWRSWSTRFDASDRFGAFARRAAADKLRPRRWMGDLAADGRAEVLGGFGA